MLQRDKNILSEPSKDNLTTVSGEKWIKNKYADTVKGEKHGRKNIKRGELFLIATHMHIKY